MLPPEILDHIFSYTDPVALKACLRAYPIFRNLVEPHLYAHIAVLDDPVLGPNGFSPVKFTNLRLSNPHVADYVRSLHITIPSLPFPFNSETLWQGMIWIWPRFRKLQRISLVSSNVLWRDLPLDFREHFMCCLRSPSLVEVSISVQLRDRFPLSFLVGCIGLKSLTLKGDFDSPDQNLSFPFLESLSICGTSFFLLRHFSLAELPKLHSFNFRPAYHFKYSHLPRFLQHCSDTLTSLELEFGVICMSHYDPCFYLQLTITCQFTFYEGSTILTSRSLCLAFCSYLSLLYVRIQVLIRTLKPLSKIIPFSS